MALNNYADLVAALSRYAATGDIVNDIPNIISFVESEINAHCPIPELSQISEFTVLDGMVTLPSNLASIDAVTCQKQILEYMTPASYISNTEVTAYPCYYTVSGNNTLMVRASDNTKILVSWVAKVTPLANAGDYSILQQYPLLYLYGGLYFIMQLRQEPENTAYYLALFEQQMANVIKGQTDNIGVLSYV